MFHLSHSYKNGVEYYLWNVFYFIEICNKIGNKEDVTNDPLVYQSLRDTSSVVLFSLEICILKLHKVFSYYINFELYL